MTMQMAPNMLASNWEIAMLLKVGRIALQEPYGEWTEHLLAQPDLPWPQSTSAYSLKHIIITSVIHSIA